MEKDEFTEKELSVLCKSTGTPTNELIDEDLDMNRSHSPADNALNSEHRCK